MTQARFQIHSFVVLDNNYIQQELRNNRRIFSLLSRNESRLIKTPACLSVCKPLITFEPIGGF
jgi:hypothetical protein